MNINDKSLAMLTPARCRLLPLTKMKITPEHRPNTKNTPPIITVRYTRRNTQSSLYVYLLRLQRSFLVSLHSNHTTPTAETTRT